MTEQTVAPEATPDRKTAKASWMRAKWARERAERAEIRLTNKIAEESDPEKQKALRVDAKEAKALLSSRIKAEKEARKAYDAAAKA
jgi:phage protein D